MIPEDQIELPVSLSLAPYTGTWTKTEAAHLLRRTLFGPTYQKIVDAETNGLDATVTQLLIPPMFAEPLVFSANETIAPFGTSWVNSVFPSDGILAQQNQNTRNESIGAWLIERINKENMSIHEKMCLFWQNHFAAEPTFDARATYQYHHLIRTHALGNFKTFVKEMTINPSMLVFLNGAQNNQFSPNENYSRELLELFSIGKGLQVGEGDYTNYTEQDVMEGAKILTGWTIQDFMSDTVSSPSSYFEPILHDTSTKTLSNRLGNTSVPNANELEYSNYIDIIFQQNETAHFICKKFYRWFVNYDLTDVVETTVVSEMATLLLANNYEILPVVEALLKSEHFYDMSVRGSIIKNPLEHVFSIFNSTSTIPNYTLDVNYRLYLQIYWFSGSLGMYYAQPPNVGGWPAYYQAPNFSKLWINSSYIKLRFDLSSYITLWGGLDVDGNRLPIDHFAFLDNLSLPSDAPQVIEDIVLVFCPKGLSTTQKLTLKLILTNGLPDFEWTLQYNEYIANPGDTSFSDPVKQRLAITLDQLFKLPEFQTI